MGDLLTILLASAGAHSKSTSNPLAIADHGWLTGVQVIALQNAPRGRYYAQLALYANSGISQSNLIGILWGGYITTGETPMSLPNVQVYPGYALVLYAWSGTNGATTDRFQANAMIEGERPSGGGSIFAEPPGSGRGEFLKQTVATPAAGANPVAVAAPAYTAWRWIGVTFQLVTAAAVANRQAQLLVTDGTDFMAGSAGAVQTASTTVNYLGAFRGSGGSGVVSGNGVGSLCTPDGQFYNGAATFEISIGGLQAADQVNPVGGGSKITFEVEEWVIPD